MGALVCRCLALSVSAALVADNVHYVNYAESWLERDHLMLLDFAPKVVAVVDDVCGLPPWNQWDTFVG